MQLRWARFVTSVCFEAPESVRQAESDLQRTSRIEGT